MTSRQLLVGALALAVLSVPALALSQTRAMAQDPKVNNLMLPEGVPTAPSGALGRVQKVGTGPRTMLLIPGLGFGDGIWSEFMERHKADATMFAITLPGFGGTAPLAMPRAEAKYADLPWTWSAINAIEGLLRTERLDRVTIVAHWALSTQIAFELALTHPEKVEAVIVIGGPLKVYYEASPAMLTWTAAQRAQFVEGMGTGWFKTVTRQTWDDNNFMSYDYAINPRRGLFLWREAQAPSLAVWIRYLLEFYSFDQTARLAALKVPVLVVQPGFDDPGVYVEPDRNYMRNLCLDSWRDARTISDKITFVTVPRSRLFVMFDQPEALDRAIADFLGRVAAR